MMQTTTSLDEQNQPTYDSLLPASYDTSSMIDSMIPSSSSSMPITEPKLDNIDTGIRQKSNMKYKRAPSAYTHHQIRELKKEFEHNKSGFNPDHKSNRRLATGIANIDISPHSTAISTNDMDTSANTEQQK